MNQKTDLSIIIPCHKIEDYIYNCLYSISMQKDIENLKTEIIIVLDRCADQTEPQVHKANKELFNPCLKKYFRVKILKGSFGCAGYSRNAGFEEAEGKYIWFIDGDDFLISPYAIKNLMQITQKDEPDIIHFDFSYGGVPTRFNENGGNLFPCVWNKIIKKEIIGNVRFSDKRVAEDLEFINKILPLCKKQMVLGNILYYYNYPREDSLSFENSKGNT